MKKLSEQFAEGFFDTTDTFYFDLEVGAVETAEVGCWDEYLAESEFLSFGDALHDAADRTNLTTQTYFACHADITVDACIDIAREDGGDDAEVDGWIGDPDATCDVEIDILLPQFEAYTFLEYSQKHVESAQVETRSRALWSAIGGSADECLGLDE